MIGMVLAAGAGRRLGDDTRDLPKTLLPVDGDRTILDVALGNLALGWDGRLVLGYILLVANALPAGFYVAAGLFASVFVTESISGWRRFGRAAQPATYEDEEDDG